MLESPHAAAQFDAQESLARLSAMLTARAGLALAPTQWGDLQRAVISAAAELGLADFRAGIDCLLNASNPRPLQVLLDHLTIGETYFFRDKAVFALLREQLLPTLIYARRGSGERRIRIWSAGCSSGEEAYSIAIELTRALPDLAQWDATILATDINQRFLRKAAAGVYDRWSFRDSDPEQREPYIQRNAQGRFAIAPAVKALVRFTSLNLAEKIYPSALNGTANIDIIFCRNVLMYLKPDMAAAALQRLCDALVPDGWLIVSNVEAPLVDLPTMTTIHLPDLILFHKKIPSAQAPKKIAGRSARLGARSELGRKQPSVPKLAAATADKSTPRGIEKNLSQAQRLFEQGLYLEAEKILAENPDDARKLLLLAKIGANQGRFQAALQHCEQALAVDKLNPAAHYLQASILLETHATSLENNATQNERGAVPADVANIAAEEALKRALYLDSEWVMAHIALGNLLLAQPVRKVQAQRHFDNARALLTTMPAQQVVAESEGLTAGELLAMINVMSIAEIAP